MNTTPTKAQFSEIVREDADLCKIYNLLGPIILVSSNKLMGRQEGAPTAFTFAEAQEAGYARALTQFPHVGLRCGPESGNICACALPKRPMKEFVILNSALSQTMLIECDNVYFMLYRIVGSRPPTTELGVGYWCGDGCIIPLMNRDPGAKGWRWVTDYPPLDIEFNQIQWPETISQPFHQRVAQGEGDLPATWKTSGNQEEVYRSLVFQKAAELMRTGLWASDHPILKRAASLLNRRPRARRRGR